MNALYRLVVAAVCTAPILARPVAYTADDAPARVTRVEQVSLEARHARLAVDRPVAEMKLEGALRLADFFDEVGEATGISFAVNWAALSAAGVEGDPAVIVRPNGRMPLAKVLDLVLSDAAPAGGARLGWILLDTGVIEVSTREDLYARHAVVRVYDLRDSVCLPRGSQDRAARAAAVAKIITDTIDPESWTAEGRAGASRVAGMAAGEGVAASLRVRDGMFVITQTADNHRQIETLLGMLQHAIAAAPPAAGFGRPR